MDLVRAINEFEAIAILLIDRGADTQVFLNPSGSQVFDERRGQILAHKPGRHVSLPAFDVPYEIKKTWPVDYKAERAAYDEIRSKELIQKEWQKKEWHRRLAAAGDPYNKTKRIPKPALEEMPIDDYELNHQPARYTSPPTSQSYTPQQAHSILAALNNPTSYMQSSPPPRGPPRQAEAFANSYDFDQYESYASPPTSPGFHTFNSPAYVYGPPPPEAQLHIPASYPGTLPGSIYSQPGAYFSPGPPPGRHFY
ncbi:hypothetical protein K491DRAFT_717330 [Lophiostoma macrostomum CBS 122681]|uniref:Uncharacterized protein n=1 Tax=Lophiostoma macrostomum CBS 122681 TaxID=1314788 RepID=A0A6A6T303_9PLEO|nr:hypothetical protein K491DRAFT_717330 [Lophiostoma macrostomum CBS 122681]